MITKEIDIGGEKFLLTLTDQIINQVNNLKSLYNVAYEDPESFEQVSAEISSTIQEISKAVKPKPDDSHLDNLIQQVIKTVDDKTEEANKQLKDKPITKKSKKKNKKTKSKK
jgi:poly-D-alanine transfer protein DltD